MYDNVKKKRLPPGAVDPLKEGGKGAEELVQAIAADKGAEGLQQWMDKQGLGTTVMSAADASKKREEAKVAALSTRPTLAHRPPSLSCARTVSHRRRPPRPRAPR